MTTRNPDRPRVIYNDDTCSLRFLPGPHTPERAALAVDYLAETQVDWLCWLMGSGLAYGFRSERVENFYDKIPPSGGAAGDLTLSLYRKGVDYVPILIREAHERGILFFASFRMNDTHHTSDPDGPLAPDFWKERQHLRLWEVDEAQGYYNAALDYSSAEVRNHMENAIAEALDRYDVDGVELDFCRGWLLFQPSEAWEKREILTAFVSGIRDRVRTAGERRGLPLRLILRVPFARGVQRRGGMDVETWIAGRLCDALVMSSHDTDYNVELEPWLSLCRRAGVPLFPSIEKGPAFDDRNIFTVIQNPLAPPHNLVVAQTPEELCARHAAAARTYWSRGADGIYLFNFPCALFEKGNPRFADPPAFERMVSSLSRIGSPETLRGVAKEYLFWPAGPVRVETGRPPRYHQTAGFFLDDPDAGAPGMRTVVSFRRRTEKNPHVAGRLRPPQELPPGTFRILLNGEPVPETSVRVSPARPGRIPSGWRLKSHAVVSFDAPASALRRGANVLSFEMPGRPAPRSPYVYIFELAVSVRPGSDAQA